MHNVKDKTLAFTLVELSIVMIIIALIIGGVLSGQTLVEQAELNSMIRKLDSYDNAVLTFRLKYNALPGDLTPRQANNFGFLQRTGGNHQGDGNNKIGADSAVVRAEHLLFWRDLSDAGLIDQPLNSYTDITSSPLINATDLTGYLPKLNVSLLKTPIVLAYYDGTLRSHVFYIISALGTNGTGGLSQTSLPNANIAYEINTKYDDGLPESGNIRSMYNASCVDTTTTPVTYNTTSGVNCKLHFLRKW